MVEIEYRPIRKIVILELISFETPEKLATILVPGKLLGQPVSLNWANGVLFIAGGLPPTTDKLMDEFTKGVIHWQNVQYALMPQYKPIITVSSDVSGTAEIGVMDVSMNQNLVEVASWLKNFSASKP